MSERISTEDLVVMRNLEAAQMAFARQMRCLDDGNAHSIRFVKNGLDWKIYEDGVLLAEAATYSSWDRPKYDLLLDRPEIQTALAKRKAGGG